MAKIIYNKFIPFKGFIAINIFGIIFVRNEYKEYINNRHIYFNRLVNHELIHTEQIKELGYIFFYIWYIIEWIIRLVICIFKHKKLNAAYYAISFEQEAFNNESNYIYRNNRKHYSFLKYI